MAVEHFPDQFINNYRKQEVSIFKASANLLYRECKLWGTFSRSTLFRRYGDLILSLYISLKHYTVTINKDKFQKIAKVTFVWRELITTISTYWYWKEYSREKKRKKRSYLHCCVPFISGGKPSFIASKESLISPRPHKPFTWFRSLPDDWTCTFSPHSKTSVRT